MSDKKDLNEFAPAAVPIASTAARFGAGQMIKTGALAAGAAAAFSPKVRRFASHALGLDKTPEQSTASLNKAGEKLGITTPATPASSTPSSGGSASTPTNKPEAPKPAAVDKPVTYDKNKYAIYNKDSSSAKSFRDTFAAQKAAGASEFKWKGGDNVERSYSTKSAPETKPADVPLPPSRPTDLNKPESESGGKKKKMSEETNPLIAAFLKLQETKATNIFEAAKKAKKDYDKDGKVESPKDEVWGSRFRAAKAAGKMEEGSMMDPNDPSVQGGSDVTSTPVKSVKPVAPKKVDGDPSYQGSGDVTMSGKPVRVREEVEFSQAEIDHINSFFEAVAPSRAEPTKDVNPSVSNISLTDGALEEGRPRKNPEPESTERDARQHIQVIAGRAAAGNTLDFPHNDGSKSKITPAMGRKITSHLQGLKPAERQAAVNKMHASAEGLKI